MMHAPRSSVESRTYTTIYARSIFLFSSVSLYVRYLSASYIACGSTSILYSRICTSRHMTCVYTSNTQRQLRSRFVRARASASALANRNCEHTHKSATNAEQPAAAMAMTSSINSSRFMSWCSWVAIERRTTSTRADGDGDGEIVHMFGGCFWSRRADRISVLSEFAQPFHLTIKYLRASVRDVFIAHVAPVRHAKRRRCRRTTTQMGSSGFWVERRRTVVCGCVVGFLLLVVVQDGNFASYMGCVFVYVWEYCVYLDFYATRASNGEAGGIVCEEGGARKEGNERDGGESDGGAKVTQTLRSTSYIYFYAIFLNI